MNRILSRIRCTGLGPLLCGALAPVRAADPAAPLTALTTRNRHCAKPLTNGAYATATVCRAALDHAEAHAPGSMGQVAAPAHWAQYLMDQGQIGAALAPL